MNEPLILAAGRAVPDALDRIRRYCGLRWAGGAPETWAWHYYDCVPTGHDDDVSAVDVLCVSALHPGLSRDDLDFFRTRRDDLGAWLADLPSDRSLWELDDNHLEHLCSMPEALAGPSVSLLSKVLHRKRPHLIPPIDRHVLDWYRPVTRQRAAGPAWAPLVRAMRDEQLDGERRRGFEEALGPIDHALRADAPQGLSWLRAVDIAIWMGSR